MLKDSDTLPKESPTTLIYFVRIGECEPSAVQHHGLSDRGGECRGGGAARDQGNQLQTSYITFIFFIFYTGKIIQ